MAKLVPEDHMYSEWSSLPVEGGGSGVLGSLGSGGKDVVIAVVKQLQIRPSPLSSDGEVEWVLEVIRYGLSLPFTEHECIRECVKVCCAWLAELQPNCDTDVQPAPPPTPAPVKAAPHRYARLIFSHLHNLFVPRPSEGPALTSKQAVLCHRVLRVLTSACTSFGASEWRAALRLALAAAHAQLAPPEPPLGAAQMCERGVAVLFQLTIMAAHRSFPSPPYWKTLREHCMQWRHRITLIEQWTKCSLALTQRLLVHMYGPLFPRATEDDTELVPADMTPEAVSQAWCRILHTIGDPVDLCRPYIIAQTPQFLQYALCEDGGKEPHQHPCLQALPIIFLKAMKGVSAHVDAFLGISRMEHSEETILNEGGSPVAIRPPAKSFSSNLQTKPKENKAVSSRSSMLGPNPNPRPLSSVTPVTTTTPPNSITSHHSVSEVETERPPLASMRPNVNSIFHLFGDWLFKASMIGTPELIPHHMTQKQRVEGTPPPPINDPSKILIPVYQPGRAEALGALCRVLCSKKSREDVQTIYSARCYLAIQKGLRDPHTAAAVIINAQDIFRVDLEGILVLYPDFLSALEKILPEREPKINCEGIDKSELRGAAVTLLLSMVALPFHYKGLAIPELPGTYDFRGMCMGDLCGRVSALCLLGVQTEWNGPRATVLLSALHLALTHAVNINSPAGDSVCGSSGSTVSAGNEIPVESLTKDLDPHSPLFGSTLVIKSTYLVCHRLISSWKGEMRVSIAALELLSSLAGMHTDPYEASRAVRWICDFVYLQTSRPPPAHSRELHSCLVCAFQCLANWINLFKDNNALQAAMEVVELGLSGSVSEKSGAAPIMKEEKELKPVSLRVRDAAEHLLYLIMEQCEELSPIDENWLAARGHGKLRHYIADDSIILSILEEPLINSEEPHPSLVLLIRGSFGRWAWCVGARGWSTRAAACPRPVAICDTARSYNTNCRSLPTGPPCPADAAFPSLDFVLRQLHDPEAPTLFKLLEQQTHIEKEIRETEDKLPEELTPPDPVTEFQTARMFLANFGYLNITPDTKSPPRLALLEGGDTLESSLSRLDSYGGARASCTAHLFCVKTGQNNAKDIVANTLKRDSVTPHFMVLLAGLGKPVMVKTHSGWSGHITTAYRAQPTDDSNEGNEFNFDSEHGGAAYDGFQQVLYWSDATTEIAFVVPSPIREGGEGASVCDESDTNSLNSGTQSQHAYDRSFSANENVTQRVPLSEKMKTGSLDCDKTTTTSYSLTGSGKRNRHYTTKVLIIWLEDYEDHLQLPIDDLLKYTDTGEAWRRNEVVVICCSALKESLFRVRVSSNPAWLASPTIAPQLVRTVALQKAKQRSLLDDTYQPPHVKRRHLIQELAQQFKTNLSEPELLESLFIKQ